MSHAHTTSPPPERGAPLAETLLWLCSIPSPTGEEGPLCDAIAARLTHRQLAAAPRRHLNSLVVPVSSGTGGPRIVLAGHLDVVRTQHDGPPRVEGDRLYGPGAADMKSGLAVMLALLDEPDAYRGCDLTLVFYSCEEGPYDPNELGAVLAGEPELSRQDLAVCLEPSDNRLQLGCNGSLQARVAFRGRTAHSARPWQGENAIHKAAPLLTRLAALEPIEYRDGDLSYFSVTSATLAEGGRGRNVIPDEFRLNLSHRFTPGTTNEEAAAYLRELVGEGAELDVSDISPSAPTFARHPLVEKLRAAGVAAVEPKQAWTDVARFARYGVPAVNFGPGTNAQAHQRNEWTHLPLLDESLAIFRRFLGSLSPGDRPTPTPEGLRPRSGEGRRSTFGLWRRGGVGRGRGVGGAGGVVRGRRFGASQACRSVIFTAVAMRVGHLIGPELRAILRENPEAVKGLLEELHPEDIADVVAEFPEAEAAKLLSGIAAEDAATIFERLEDDTQEAIAEEMGPESVAHIAAEMAVDDRVELLSALDDEMSEAVLAKLEKVDPVAAGEVVEHEKWPEHSAGRLMTTDFIAVQAGLAVQDAIAAVRFAPEAESVHYVYVLSAERSLVAAASLRDLLLAEPATPLSEVARVNLIAVPPTMDQEDVAKRLAKYDLVALPVVDDAGKVLGIVTVDDVIDVLTEEQTEDVQKLGAVEPLEDTYFATTFWTFIRKRATWLMVLFVGEFFTSTAMRYYDDALQAITALAFYVPLLVSTGGNSGGQSSSLIIRGMAVGEIKLKDWWRVLGRELGQGAVLGLVLAVVGFGRVLLWKDGSRFAFVVALTLVGIVMMGCVVGSMLPFALKRFRLDPATSSAPFIASLVDVLGIVIYFNVARVLMSDVIDAAVRKGVAH